jgi:leucyl-tRNA synthetase
MLNPIVPHFAEYCWTTHLLPILNSKAKNLPKAPAERLLDQGWPQVVVFSPVKRRMYEYIKAVKSNVRLAQEKAKGGGKKHAKGGAAPEKAAPLENVAIFVAPEYPDWQKAVLEILAAMEWDAEDKVSGNAYVNLIKEKIPGPKAGFAMKFAAFVVKEAQVVGKEAALELTTPFNEMELLEGTRDFVFENMPGLKNVRILSAQKDDDGLEGAAKASKEAALPGKPAIFFY